MTDGGEPDLLRFFTAGSVDDGKSTLIGRLLHDTRSIFQDQLDAVTAASRRRGDPGVNLALLTDGLRAEREQNITIDVAYRYFATAKRKFIVADTPGHLQYTRNMVTGASTAELAIVLIDARHGALTQSRRHAVLSALLRIPHMLVAVNKMDLVGYRQDTFDAIVADYRAFAERLGIERLTFTPVSALLGDNVVRASDHMPWHRGGTLLHQLETVEVGTSGDADDFRFPVQYVIRPHQDYRGLAGRVASGVVRPGDDIVVLPSGQRGRIRAIETADGPLPECVSGDSVVLTIEGDLDIGRGDMLAPAMHPPTVARRIDALLCWMGETPLDPAVPYLCMHTTRQTTAFVDRGIDRLDVDTLHWARVPFLALNDVGRVQIATAQPLCFDAYQENRRTGHFILVDPFTNATVAAGMILGGVGEARRGEAWLGEASLQEVRLREAAPAADQVSPNVVWDGWNIPRAEREARNGHAAAVVWLTGLPGSGKSTITRLVERRLFDEGHRTTLLDGDALRHGLCGDLGFSAADRTENIRRAGEVARLCFEHGSIVLCAFVSPSRADRDGVRRRIGEGRFVEVHLQCDLGILQRRDPKQLYARAAAGLVHELTGLTAPYEVPLAPELTLDTGALSPDACAELVIERMRSLGVLASR